jgi:hypothetical protein
MTTIAQPKGHRKSAFDFLVSHPTIQAALGSSSDSDHNETIW